MPVKDTTVIDYSKPLENNKYERFCQEYIIDNNKTQAALRAKYSERTAYSQGQRLLKKVEVTGRVRYLQNRLSDKSGVKAVDVIRELAKLGFSNIQDFIEKGMSFKDLTELDRDIAAAVESVQVDIRHDGGDSKAYNEKVKLKLYDKKGALVELGRHLGIYEKDNEQKKESLVEFLRALVSKGSNE